MDLAADYTTDVTMLASNPIPQVLYNCSNDPFSFGGQPHSHSSECCFNWVPKPEKRKLSFPWSDDLFLETEP